MSVEVFDPPTWKLKINEPAWKHLIVSAIWQQARDSNLLISGDLPKGLGEMVEDVRARCDRCGRSNKQILAEDYPDRSANFRSVQINNFQCCWVRNAKEEYCLKLCDKCHNVLRKIRPHDVTSV